MLIDLVNVHLGYAEQARNFPLRPSFITNFEPHLGQVSCTSSIFTTIISPVCLSIRTGFVFRQSG